MKEDFSQFDSKIEKKEDKYSFITIVICIVFLLCLSLLPIKIFLYNYRKAKIIGLEYNIKCNWYDVEACIDTLKYIRN